MLGLNESDEHFNRTKCKKANACDRDLDALAVQITGIWLNPKKTD